MPTLNLAIFQNLLHSHTKFWFYIGIKPNIYQLTLSTKKLVVPRFWHYQKIGSAQILALPINWQLVGQRTRQALCSAVFILSVRETCNICFAFLCLGVTVIPFLNFFLGGKRQGELQAHPFYYSLRPTHNIRDFKFWLATFDYSSYSNFFCKYKKRKVVLKVL